VDTGASKCNIPATLNDRIFHFPIVGHDSNVTTASNPRGFDIVTIPRICLSQVTVVSNQLQVTDTPLEEQNISAWLGDSFILGMNFLSRFDISMFRNGRITIGR
jgi:predicted aspartyl protease